MSPSVLPPGALRDPRVAILRRRRRLWLIWGVVVVLLAVIALPSLYRSGKQWRARQLAAQAETLLAAGQVKEAAARAQAAVELAPSGASALRALARAYTAGGSGMALGYWKALTLLPQATPADRGEAARFALAAGQLDFADDQIELLLQAEPAKVATLELAGEAALQRNDRERALGYLERLLRQDPAHEGAKLLQAQIQAASTDLWQQEKGRRALLALGQGKGKGAGALGALMKLAQSTPLSDEQARTVAAALEAHPLSRTAEKLAALRLRLRLEPGRRGEFIQQAIAEFGQSGPDDLVALGRWMRQQGEAERVLEIISPAEAMSREDLLLVRLDALAALGHWREIQQTLEKEKPPIEPLYVQIFLARAARQLGEDEDANAHWSIALAGAALPRQAVYLAHYAETAGERRVAEKAWRQLARTPAWTLRAQLALLPLLEAAGDTRGLRDAMQVIVKLAPNDPASRNDAAYLDLLLQENLGPAEQTADELLRAHPEVLAYRTTLALAYMRTGRPAEARRLYENLDVPWVQASPRQRAIRAAALGESAATNPAFPMPDPSSLLPEERALLAAPKQPAKAELP